jgi:hypothetical protein
MLTGANASNQFVNNKFDSNRFGSMTGNLSPTDVWVNNLATGPNIDPNSPMLS